MIISVTSIKYMRRSGLDWLTISKISGRSKIVLPVFTIQNYAGHKNLVNLIKNYDLSMEGIGLANIAAAIATGPSVAQGEDFEEVVLETQKTQKIRRSKPEAAPKSSLQPSFPVSLAEQMSSTSKKRKISSSKEKKRANHIDSSDTDGEEQACRRRAKTSERVEACFELDSSVEYEPSPSPVKKLKKTKKTVGKKRLMRLLDECDKKKCEKVNFIRKKFNRDMSEREEKLMRQERMQIVWDILDDSDADSEDRDQAATIDEKFNYEEEMKAWKLKKDKEEEEKGQAARFPQQKLEEKTWDALSEDDNKKQLNIEPKFSQENRVLQQQDESVFNPQLQDQNLLPQDLQHNNLLTPHMQHQNIAPQYLQQQSPLPQHLQQQSLQQQDESVFNQQLQDQNLLPQDLQHNNLLTPHMQHQNIAPQYLQQQSPLPQHLQQQSLISQHIQQQSLISQHIQQQSFMPQLLQPQRFLPQLVQQQSHFPLHPQQQSLFSQYLHQQSFFPQNLQQLHFLQQQQAQASQQMIPQFQTQFQSQLVPQPYLQQTSYIPPFQHPGLSSPVAPVYQPVGLPQGAGQTCAAVPALRQVQIREVQVKLVSILIP